MLEQLGLIHTTYHQNLNLKNYADAGAQMVATTVMAALEEDSVYTITPSFAGTPYKRSTAPWRTASLPTLEVPTEDTRKDPRRPSTTKDMTCLITDPRTPLATEDTMLLLGANNFH